MSDIDRTVRALVASLDEAPLPVSGNELSPILSVLTVLLSIDRRKPDYVEERIKRLRSPDPGYGTLAGIRAYAALLTPEKYFLVDARDEGKRAGLLLPLLDALIDGMRDASGSSEAERAHEWAKAARPSDWSFAPFRGLGLRGFQHLRQLLGANTVLPTKEHAAFVGRAVGRAVDMPEAVLLLERAAVRLGYDLGAISTEEWSKLAGDPA
ncbi:MAG TPA: hypothetical protein PLL76_17400 [Thermoanaerobaculia bacterium]|nr:hypothetical protein [Thermoanaerobaculia bacterium]